MTRRFEAISLRARYKFS